VGIDVVDVARVERLLRRKGSGAVARLLTEGERSYCMAQPQPARHIAARLAAKEAAFKALQAGGGRRMVMWREVEVRRDAHGEPSLTLHRRARTYSEELRVRRVLVSMSHSDSQAVAIVLLLA
jgi:holo-[acyl-carrier protein] synthase